jgi:hypothetical protein
MMLRVFRPEVGEERDSVLRQSGSPQRADRRRQRRTLMTLSIPIFAVGEVLQNPGNEKGGLSRPSQF